MPKAHTEPHTRSPAQCPTSPLPTEAVLNGHEHVVWQADGEDPEVARRRRIASNHLALASVLYVAEMLVARATQTHAPPLLPSRGPPFPALSPPPSRSCYCAWWGRRRRVLVVRVHAPSPSMFPLCPLVAPTRSPSLGPRRVGPSPPAMPLPSPVRRRRCPRSWRHCHRRPRPHPSSLPWPRSGGAVVAVAFGMTWLPYLQSCSSGTRPGRRPASPLATERRSTTTRGSPFVPQSARSRGRSRRMRRVPVVMGMRVRILRKMGEGQGPRAGAGLVPPPGDTVQGPASLRGVGLAWLAPRPSGGAPRTECPRVCQPCPRGPGQATHPQAQAHQHRHLACP